jgi:hypothetical protein
MPGSYPVSTAGIFVPAQQNHAHFFAALLNSALANAWYKLRDLNRAIKISYLRLLPVPHDLQRWMGIGRLAEEYSEIRLSLHDDLGSCVLRQEHRTLARSFPRVWSRMEDIRQEIDRRIFDLYQISRARRKEVLQIAAARVL